MVVCAVTPPHPTPTYPHPHLHPPTFHAELVLGLAVRDLVRSKPLADRTHSARQQSFQILVVTGYEMCGERVTWQGRSGSSSSSSSSSSTWKYHQNIIEKAHRECKKMHPRV